MHGVTLTQSAYQGRFHGITGNEIAPRIECCPTQFTEQKVKLLMASVKDKSDQRPCRLRFHATHDNIAIVTSLFQNLDLSKPDGLSEEFQWHLDEKFTG